MRSLQEQLRAKGLASEKSFREAKARQDLGDQQMFSGFRVKSTEELEACTTVATFKKAAKELLLGDPEQIQAVIKAAHQFKGQPGGKKLIWLCYQVRDRLDGREGEELERLLQGAFRKANPVLD